jgi:hypothetical protein
LPVRALNGRFKFGLPAVLAEWGSNQFVCEFKIASKARVVGLQLILPTSTPNGRSFRRFFFLAPLWSARVAPQIDFAREGAQWPF